MWPALSHPYPHVLVPHVLVPTHSSPELSPLQPSRYSRSPPGNASHLGPALGRAGPLSPRQFVAYFRNEPFWPTQQGHNPPGNPRIVQLGDVGGGVLGVLREHRDSSPQDHRARVPLDHRPVGIWAFAARLYATLPGNRIDRALVDDRRLCRVSYDLPCPIRSTRQLLPRTGCGLLRDGRDTHYSRRTKLRTPKPLDNNRGNAMNETTSQKPEESIPEAVVVRRRGLSPVWLVPIIAAGVAASLLYTTFERRGKTVEISFSEASGVDAGKTRVRYRDVFIGTVSEVRLSDDFTHTVIEAQINENGERLLVEGTRFWVERPRIGPQGISGLTTLVSGAYIALDPGTLGRRTQTKVPGPVRSPANAQGGQGTAPQPEQSLWVRRLDPNEPGPPRGNPSGPHHRTGPGQRSPRREHSHFRRREICRPCSREYSFLERQRNRRPCGIQWNRCRNCIAGDSPERLQLSLQTLGSGGRPVETGHSYQVFKNRQGRISSLPREPRSPDICPNRPTGFNRQWRWGALPRGQGWQSARART